MELGKRTSVTAANYTNDPLSWDRSLLAMRSADVRFCASILICVYTKEKSKTSDCRGQGKFQVQLKEH